MRPVSFRISALAAGSDKTGDERTGLGVSAFVRASLRHSATVRLSKTLATWNLRPTLDGASRRRGDRNARTSRLDRRTEKRGRGAARGPCETFGQKDDDDDEGRSEHELPDERQVAREACAKIVDRERPKDGAEQRPPASERNPDHELGTKQKASVLWRDDPGRVREQEADESRDARQRDGQRDLDAPRADAEIGAAEIVVAHGDQQLARVRTDEDPRRHGRRDKNQAAHPKETFEVERQCVIADQPAARPGQHAARIDELRDNNWENQRDHRSVQRGRAVIEGEPADHEAENDRQEDSEGDRRPHPCRGGAKARHSHRRRVGADAEERGLPEGENAGKAPQEIDRHGERGVEHRPRKNVDRECAQQKRGSPDNHRAGHNRRRRGPPSRSNRARGTVGKDGRVLRHARSPADLSSAPAPPAPRWKCRQARG
jgi:hypothetical protein